jgi:probable phosphoglycerate mutase
MRLYFARHGESEANVARSIANRGWSHPLTDLGRRQAGVLAGRLQADLVGVAPSRIRILSSPLQRAVETGGIVALSLGRTVERTDALREADCGVMEGRGDPQAWAAHDAVESRWLAGDHTAAIEGGECLDDLLARFVPWIDSLVREASEAPDTAIVAIGHGTLYRFVLSAVVSGPDGAPIARPELDKAEAIVTETGGSGRLLEVARWSTTVGS